jgi:hypothetical protein
MALHEAPLIVDISRLAFIDGAMVLCIHFTPGTVSSSIVPLVCCL